ncbi:MAG: hypothetical protein U0271_10475 [Polyangiaceae bacterium]
MKVGAGAPAAEEHAPHGAAHAARRDDPRRLRQARSAAQPGRELVLGRDRLRSAFRVLASITTELSADPRLRATPRRERGSPAHGRAAGLSGRGLNDPRPLLDFAEDLGESSACSGPSRTTSAASTGYLGDRASSASR